MLNHKDTKNAKKTNDKHSPLCPLCLRGSNESLFSHGCTQINADKAKRVVEQRLNPKGFYPCSSAFIGG